MISDIREIHESLPVVKSLLLLDTCFFCCFLFTIEMKATDQVSGLSFKGPGPDSGVIGAESLHSFYTLLSQIKTKFAALGDNHVAIQPNQRTTVCTSAGTITNSDASESTES